MEDVGWCLWEIIFRKLEVKWKMEEVINLHLITCTESLHWEVKAKLKLLMRKSQTREKNWGLRGMKCSAASLPLVQWVHLELPLRIWALSKFVRHGYIGNWVDFDKRGFAFMIPFDLDRRFMEEICSQSRSWVLYGGNLARKARIAVEKLCS